MAIGPALLPAMSVKPEIASGANLDGLGVRRTPGLAAGGGLGSIDLRQVVHHGLAGSKVSEYKPILLSLWSRLRP